MGNNPSFPKLTVVLDEACDFTAVYLGDDLRWQDNTQPDVELLKALGYEVEERSGCFEGVEEFASFPDKLSDLQEA